MNRITTILVLVGLLRALFSSPPTVAADCSTPETTTGGFVLTFDDHHIAQWHGIRDLLARYGVKATFFICGYNRLSSADRSRVQELAADGHEIASHSRDHKRATTYCPREDPNCDLSPEQRAEWYLNEQILPHLDSMASDGLYPRSFAYPFGADLPETTDLLVRYFGHVRDTRNYNHYQDALVSCADGQFIASLGFDCKHDTLDSEYLIAMDEAMCDDKNLILHGHHINNHPSGLYVDEERLESFIVEALSRGLNPRRIRDICSWQTTSLDGPWNNVFDTPRPLSNVHIADFDGDGYADAFRTNGLTWELLRGSEEGFDTPSYNAYWEHWNTSIIELDQLYFGDFDSDGRTDIFWPSADLWHVSYGGEGPLTRINNSKLNPDQFRFADFDGDGATDIFVVRDGRWLVSYSGRSRWQLINHSIHDHEQFRFGDFDGDGRTDVFHARGGKWWVSYGGTTDWARINASVMVPEQPSLVDIDGDGSTDIFRTDGANWWVSYGGSTRWSHLRSSSVMLDDLVFANLDGEGPADILRLDSKLP